MNIFRAFALMLLLITLSFGRLELKHYTTGDLIRAEENSNFSNWNVSSYSVISDAAVADVIKSKRIYIGSSTGAITLVVETVLYSGTPDCTVEIFMDYGSSVVLGTITGENTVRFNFQDYNELTSPFKYFTIRIIENSIQSTQYFIRLYIMEDL